MDSFETVVGNSTISGEYFLDERAILDFPWKKTAFVDAKISGGSMTCSQFENCTFRNTTFENMYLDDVDFVRCHFENFRMINCSHDAMELRECTGTPPTLTGTKEPRSERESNTLPPDWDQK